MTKAASAEDLRDCLVTVTSKIKQGALSEVNKYYGERLVLKADWECRKVYITIIQGSGVSMDVSAGRATMYEVSCLFPSFKTMEEAIGFYPGDRPKPNFNNLYQKFILDAALAANNVLDNLPDDVEVSDEIKAQVSAILEPYREQYAHTHMY